MRNGKKILAILVLFCALFLPRAFSEDAFRILAPESVSGFQDNILTIVAPEKGKAILEILDDTTLYRRLEEEMPEGENLILWDGLGWNEEQMPLKKYTVMGTFLGASGTEYTFRTYIRQTPAQQAVLFALPSDDTVYTGSSSDWFLEIRILYSDQLNIQFFDRETGELVLQTSRQIKGSRINQLSYSSLLWKNSLSAGYYSVRVFGNRNKENFKDFSLRVSDGFRPDLPLAVTGDIMPHRGDSDEEIWEKMMEPATVVDIKSVSHQTVFASPDEGSPALGTLHGQSQALSVFEIRDKWAYIGAWTHEKGAYVEGWVPADKLKTVRPQTEYGLLVDKKAQTLTLYQNGRKVDTLLVSTGRMDKGELYQETAAGSFLTDLHMSDYSTNGLKYDFVIRYDGGNLLHQIPYAWSESGKKDMIPGEIYLGTKASHACIRVQEKPGNSGINAYWFWTHLPYHTRIIILDDPEERTDYETIITGNTPRITEEIISSWKIQHDSEDEPCITVTFGGDAVLGGRESYFQMKEGMPAFLEKEGMDWPFIKLKSVFIPDDITVVNLECVLKDDASGEDRKKLWRFRGMKAYTEALVRGGVDLVNIANNHTIDYGEEGYVSTMEALTGRIPFCGNGSNPVLEVKGYKIGFGGCRETTYCSDPGIIERDILELKARGAEFIIYQCHWGTEYEENHNVLQEAMARACIRAGADLVIGHHPHVVQGIDWIGDMPVVYSLGNLVFGGTIRLSTYDAMMVQARIYPERSNNRTELKIIPILTSSSAEKKINDYQPEIAVGSDALRILQEIQKDTPFLLTDRVTLYY